MEKMPFHATMRFKLIASFGGVLLIFLGIALFNLQHVSKIKQHMNDQNEKVELKVMALEMKELVQELNIIASGLEISKKPEFVLKYNSKRQPYNDLLKKIGDTASTPEQQKWRSQLIQASVDYINNFDSAAQMIQGNGTNPVDLQMNLLYLYNESQELKDQIFELVDHFYVTYADSADQAVNSSTQLLDQTTRVMLIAFIIVFFITIVIAFLLIRSFMRPITRLQKAAAIIAEGDLSHTIDSISRDELGQLSRSFDHMIVRVREMLGAAQGIASSLTDHSQTFRHFSELTAAANTDILKAIHEISVGADEQAEKSEISSGMIAELEAEMSMIADYTDEMKQSSQEAAAGTLKGTEAVRALKESSDRSQNVLHKVDNAMKTLASSSKQIGAITRSITEISTQTNVLSLNAAIEAARAGVHGKGFSVIAEEVRQLSQQTNDSSKSISDIIRMLQQQIQELQNSLQEAREQTLSQNSRVADTIASFLGIEQSMNHITAQIAQIHGKIEQVRRKNGILVESVHFVAAVAQQTAAGVEEVNSTSTQQDASIRQIAEEADDIHRLAAQLFAEISRFKMASGGARSSQAGGAADADGLDGSDGGFGGDGSGGARDKRGEQGGDGSGRARDKRGEHGGDKRGDRSGEEREGHDTDGGGRNGERDGRRGDGSGSEWNSQGGGAQGDRRGTEREGHDTDDGDRSGILSSYDTKQDEHGTGHLRASTNGPRGGTPETEAEREHGAVRRDEMVGVADAERGSADTGRASQAAALKGGNPEPNIRTGEAGGKGVNSERNAPSSEGAAGNKLLANSKPASKHEKATDEDDKSRSTGTYAKSSNHAETPSAQRELPPIEQSSQASSEQQPKSEEQSPADSEAASSKNKLIHA